MSRYRASRGAAWRSQSESTESWAELGQGTGAYQNVHGNGAYNLQVIGQGCDEHRPPQQFNSFPSPEGTERETANTNAMVRRRAHAFVPDPAVDTRAG